MSTEPLTTLLPRALQWLAEDPDSQTRTQLQSMIDGASDDNDSHRELADCFACTLTFGTAGLRAAMGPGPNRMNRVTVTRAAAGLGAFLSAITPQGESTDHLVIVGFDGRHNSDVFARDTCEVLTGAGIRVAVLPHALPTPVLAFAVAHLGASAGVMVTASHNPAADNGYKVYLGPRVGAIDGITYRGSQIISPHDVQIAAHIDAIDDIRELPRGDEWRTLDHAIVGAYLERALTVLGTGPRDISVVHTAMHGVGTETFTRLASMASFTDIHCVSQQAQPDPEFPTVAFPNPEEAGALDLAFTLARDINADLIVANDPDADRCAVAIPEDGQWRRLTGDDVGMLLAWWLVHRQSLPTHIEHQLPAGARFATTIVSSPWLGEFAASHGVAFRETLTGFKWLAQVPALAFGYEEALGYAVDPGAVHDKDGITAAVVVMEAAAHLKSKGIAIAEALNQIAAEHGRWYTTQVSLRMTDMSAVPQLMSRLVQNAPARVGDFNVTSNEDLATGVDGLPPTEGVRWHLEDGSRIIIRPSGTEPKVKAYVASRDEATTQALAAAIPELLRMPSE